MTRWDEVDAEDEAGEGDSEDDFFSDNEGEDDMDRFEIDEK